MKTYQTEIDACNTLIDYVLESEGLSTFDSSLLAKLNSLRSDIQRRADDASVNADEIAHGA